MSVSIVPMKRIHQGDTSGRYAVRVWWDKGYAYLGWIVRLPEPTTWIVSDKNEKELYRGSTLTDARAFAKNHWRNA